MGETGQSDNGHTSEQRTTEVQVLLLLGSSTDEGNRAHHSDGVETSTGKKSRVHEHQGGEESSLGEVEASPETILHHVVLRGRVESSEHSTHACNETQTNDSPRVCGHQTIRPSVHVESPSSNTDDTNSKTSVQKCFVQVASLIRGHSAILTSLTVEDEICRHDSSTHNGRTIQESLGHVTTLGTICGLHVRPFEGILECLSGPCENRGRSRAEGLRLRLEGRVVNKSSGVRGFGDLAECR